MRERQNVKFVQEGVFIHWEATKDVPEGAWLWGDYGPDYWKGFDDRTAAADAVDNVQRALFLYRMYRGRGWSAAEPIVLDMPPDVVNMVD